MKLAIVTNEALETSAIAPYLSRLARTEKGVKVFADERCKLGSLKVGKYTEKVKNAIKIELDGTLAKVGDHQFNLMEDGLDRDLFSPIPTLGEHTYEIIGNEIVITGSKKPVAKLVSTYEELVDACKSSLLVLTLTDSEVAGKVGEKFNAMLMDGTLPLWCTKLEHMVQYEFDYILNMQRYALINEHDIKGDFDNFMDTLLK